MEVERPPRARQQVEPVDTIDSSESEQTETPRSSSTAATGTPRAPGTLPTRRQARFEAAALETEIGEMTPPGRGPRGLLKFKLEGVDRFTVMERLKGIANKGITGVQRMSPLRASSLTVAGGMVYLSVEPDQREVLEQIQQKEHTRGSSLENLSLIHI